MNVLFTREFDSIIGELLDAIRQISGFYEAIDINSDSWDTFDEEDRYQCVRALSVDLLYALGALPSINIGNGGQVLYDRQNNVIKVFNGDNCIYIINMH